VKKYKYLVGSGCSFTEVCTPVYGDDPKQIKWLERLGLELGIEKVKTYNMGMGGAGNEFIKMNFLYKIQELLKVPDIKSSDIFVAIQWTGYERCDLFVSDEIPTIDGLDEDLQPNYFGSNYNTHKMESKPDFGWVFSGAHIGRDYDVSQNPSGHETETKMNYLTRWYKYYYTHQGMWVNTLNNILFIQNLCKAHNIDYVFCTGWNIVVDTYPDAFYNSDSSNTNTFEQYFGFKFLWDMIDFDRFIFYPSNIYNFKTEKECQYKKNREISDYGGMWQYMVERDGIDLDNRHPNKHGSKVWAEYIHNTMKDRKLL
jgi:hypothetical protein